MRKIMIVTRYYPPTQNGLADHSALLAKCLCSDFESITVVCEKQTNQEETGKNSSDGLESVKHIVFAATRQLVQVVMDAIEETRPDVVLFQYVPHMWGRAGIAPRVCMLPLWIRIRHSVPVSTYLHELHYDWSLSPKRTLLSIVHRIQLLLIGWGSTSLFVTNERRRARLARFWNTKVFCIPAGNVSGRKPDNVRHSIYPWPYIVWYGTLSEGQQLENLVNAFCGIAARFSELRLVLVGAFNVSSPRVRELRTLCSIHGVESRLVIHGFADDDKLSDILFGSSVNIHMNHSGPSGRRGVVAAYLRSGRPLIAVDGKETDPIFNHMDNVLLVPNNDPGALVNALQLVLANKPLTQKLEEGARQLFLSEFSDEVIRVKLLKAMQLQNISPSRE